jgi:hypothetical protein
MDAPWTELVVVCRHCGNQNLPGKPGDAVPPRVPVDGRPRLNLGGRSYVLERRLARGDSTIVYRGRWVVRLGELVVVKVLAAPTDADRLRQEWQTLKRLAESRAEGAAHFVTRLPNPVAHGIVDSDGPRPASVFGWKSGFVHTLHEVGEVHAAGVSGPIVVWLLKRLLELLGFVHRSGFVHGAVTPDHVLVHPYDHGAMLVGWTCAETWAPGRTRALTARSGRWETLYDGATEASPTLDIAMACRVVRTVAGWHLADAVRQPPLEALLKRGAEGEFDDAWELRDLLVEVSRESFGPPAYNPLPMPGWTR